MFLRQHLLQPGRRIKPVNNSVAMKYLNFIKNAAIIIMLLFMRDKYGNIDFFLCNSQSITPF
jgi:hypothetical protein